MIIECHRRPACSIMARTGTIITNTNRGREKGIYETRSSVICVELPIRHKGQVIYIVGTFGIRVTVPWAPAGSGLSVGVHNGKTMVMLRYLLETIVGIRVAARRCTCHHLGSSVSGVPVYAGPRTACGTNINMRRCLVACTAAATSVVVIWITRSETCGIVPSSTSSILGPLGFGSVATHKQERQCHNDRNDTFALHSTIIISLLFCLLYTHHTQIHSTKIHIFRILCKMFFTA